MTTADTLRAAAAKLRDTAAKVEYGPPNEDWEDFYGHSDLPWIALMSPALAEPLAAWLDGCAGQADAMTHPTDWGICDEPGSVQDALRVARAVLGEAS